jgi:hypothetical protein
LSRQSTTDLAKRARDELNKPVSRSTVWRVLDEDAIKPWQYEPWITDGVVGASEPSFPSCARRSDAPTHFRVYLPRVSAVISFPQPGRRLS